MQTGEKIREFEYIQPIFHHFPITRDVKIHRLIHLGTHVSLRLLRHGGPEDAASFLLVVMFYRLYIYIYTIDLYTTGSVPSGPVLSVLPMVCLYWHKNCCLRVTFYSRLSLRRGGRGPPARDLRRIQGTEVSHRMRGGPG